MNLLHSRPYKWTREGSDVTIKYPAVSFELKIPSETICITVLSQKSNFYNDFSSKIKRKVSIETWINCILGPIKDPEKGLI